MVEAAVVEAAVVEVAPGEEAMVEATAGEEAVVEAATVEMVEAAVVEAPVEAAVAEAAARGRLAGRDGQQNRRHGKDQDSTERGRLLKHDAPPLVASNFPVPSQGRASLPSSWNARAPGGAPQRDSILWGDGIVHGKTGNIRGTGSNSRRNPGVTRGTKNTRLKRASKKPRLKRFSKRSSKRSKRGSKNRRSKRSSKRSKR